MKPCSEDPNKTQFTWLLNIDLKVGAAPPLLHTAFLSVMGLLCPAASAGLDPENNHQQGALADPGGLCSAPEAQNGYQRL